MQLIVVDRNATAITAIIAIISEFQHVNGYYDWFDLIPISLESRSKQDLFDNDNNTHSSTLNYLPALLIIMHYVYKELYNYKVS